MLLAAARSLKLRRCREHQTVCFGTRFFRPWVSAGKVRGHGLASGPTPRCPAR